MLENVMKDFVIPPPPVSSVAVSGTKARFPVRRIICVGPQLCGPCSRNGSRSRSRAAVLLPEAG